MHQEVLIPQPAHSQQYDIHSSNADAEDHGNSALAGCACFIEMSIHDAHGNKIEEEVSPVQGTVRGCQMVVCLEAATCNCATDLTKLFFSPFLTTYTLRELSSVLMHVTHTCEADDNEKKHVILMKRWICAGKVSSLQE